MRTPNHRRLYGSLAVLGCLTCFSLPALAQGQGQGQGRGRDQRAEYQLQDFVARLTRITDEAERAGTAQPAVIKSLRDLSTAYGGSAATSMLLHDDFRDGDYTRNPAWQVAAGEFWVDSQGLRSRAKAAAAAPAAAQQNSNDATAALLGMVLTRMTQQQGTAQQAAAAPPKATPAVIFIPAAITNAFNMSLQVSVLDGTAPFLFGPYQGTDRRSGYRLIYKPSPENASGTLELVRLAARGSTAAGQTSTPVFLEGAAPHVIGWSRTRTGEMTVTVDGKEVMRTTDAAITGAFGGLMMANLGGDYAVREVSIAGAP